MTIWNESMFVNSNGDDCKIFEKCFISFPWIALIEIVFARIVPKYSCIIIQIFTTGKQRKGFHETGNLVIPNFTIRFMFYTLLNYYFCLFNISLKMWFFLETYWIFFSESAYTQLESFTTYFSFKICVSADMRINVVFLNISWLGH